MGAEAPTPSSPSTAAKEQTDAERLVVLRREIERLKAKQLQQQLKNQQQNDQSKAGSAAASPVAASTLQGKAFSGGMASPEFQALNKWIQDMKLLTSTGVSGCSTAASSRSNGFQKNSPTTKKDMARIAEARAMAWASEDQRVTSSSPKAPSPKSPTVNARSGCPSPLSKSVAQMVDRARPASLSSPTGATSSSRSPVAKDTGNTGGIGSSRVASTTSPSSAADPGRNATELQLDDILHEFDEIDRVYDAI